MSAAFSFVLEKKRTVNGSSFVGAFSIVFSRMRLDGKEADSVGDVNLNVTFLKQTNKDNIEHGSTRVNWAHTW